jgi:hypothetical protein
MDRGYAKTLGIRWYINTIVDKHSIGHIVLSITSKGDVTGIIIYVGGRGRKAKHQHR